VWNQRELKENENGSDSFTLSRLMQQTSVHAMNKHEHTLVKTSIFPSRAGANLKPLCGTRNYAPPPLKTAQRHPQTSLELIT
jgi:hypothetical protein